jgi:hypothetical protein
MWISTAKDLTLNDTLITSGRVTPDLGVIVSIGNTAISLPAGPDADSLCLLLGLDNAGPAGSAHHTAPREPQAKTSAKK